MSGSDPRLRRRLFLLLVALNALVYLFLIADRRIPRGHDTWQYYSTQYWFMANAAQGGGPAYWMPYMTQGTANNWHLAWQGGFLQNVLLHLAPAFEGANFVPLFHAGLFLDELLFLVGLWLLASRFFASPWTVFFVAVTGVGSCLWADQVWHNFHSYYALPLILCWIHDFLDRGERWRLFLAADLFLLQVFGNMPYLPILSGLVLLFYFAAYAGVFRRRLKEQWPHLRPRPGDAGWALLLAGVLVVVYLSLSSGAHLNGVHTGQRTSEGITRLDDFLVYGGYTNPAKYLEFLHGVSPCLDYTVFCGSLTVAFAALAFVHRPGRGPLYLAVGLALTFLFSCGFLSLVAPAVYQLPGVKYFRHVALIAPFVKLLVIFLAGHGFEGALRAGRIDGGAARLLGALFLGLAGTLALLSLGDRASLSIFYGTTQMAEPGMPAFPDFQAPAVLAGYLRVAALGAALAGGTLFLARRASFTSVVALVLLLHVAPLFAWKLWMFHRKTLPLTPAQYALQDLRPVPYIPRRSLDYAANPRYDAFRRDLLRPRERYGNWYWTTDSYLFMDAPASEFRTTDWMIPLDQLMRAYTKQPIDDRTQELATWDLWHLTFPDRHPAAARVIGLSTDKLQFFSKAHRLPSPADIAARLTAPEFRGDLLFIEGPEGPVPAPLSSDERIPVPYEVLGFDANRLRLRADLPQPAWLLYCDVWHPDWTALVNGREVPVERAQIAYKAVALGPGENVVEFRFQPALRRWCFAAVSLNSLFWIVTAVGLAVRQAMVRRPPRNPPAPLGVTVP